MNRKWAEENNMTINNKKSAIMFIKKLEDKGKTKSFENDID